ncbi:MAG: tetratricopeptide repeat protein [Candidatus Acidiferrales bacterium]
MNSKKLMIVASLLTFVVAVAWLYRNFHTQRSQAVTFDTKPPDVDFEKELERIKGELQRHPDSSFWHHQAATIYFALGRHEDFEAEIRKAIELEPRNPVLYYSAAAVYQSRGQKDEEQECVWKALELDGSNPIGNAWLGDLYAGQEKWSWAVTEYELTTRLLRQLDEVKGDYYYVDDDGIEYHVDNYRTHYPISELRKSLPRRLEEARKRGEGSVNR